MRDEIKSKLRAFHFGAVQDHERLEIERQLLVDPELLVDYFDFKRELEAATLVPAAPSLVLKSRLLTHFKSNRRAIISFGVGIAVAASLFFLMFAQQQKHNLSESFPDRVLFDAGHELPASSDVL